MGVTLQGHIQVPESRLDVVRKALPEHIRLTRQEPGCLRFDVIEHSEIPGRFDVFEEFTDAPAFDAHQDRVKTSDWGRISQGIARHYTVTGLDP